MSLGKDDGELLYRIFYPHAHLRRAQLMSRNGRFVHYTTAEAAIKILNAGEVWLRNASCMNDISEVEHGLQRLYAAYKALKFRDVLASIGIDIDAFEKMFNDHVDILRQDSYLACLSEHDDAEDEIGRLSMWRAYGKQNGVAIVMNNSAFVSESHALGAYTFPVGYFDDGEFQQNFSNIIDGINLNISKIVSVDKNKLIELIFNAFRFSALCTKHRGFSEEKEWRVVFSPVLPHPGRISSGVEIVNGVPQRVCKVKLEDIPDNGLIGLSPKSMIDRIIIGPTHYDVEVARTFMDVLSKVGVKNSYEKVYVSNIPLRI